jgi:hypothetical protein
MEVRNTGLALEERGSNRNRWKDPGGIGVKTPVKRWRLARRKCPRVRGDMRRTDVDYDYAIRIAARQPFSSDAIMR